MTVKYQISLGPTSGRIFSTEVIVTLLRRSLNCSERIEPAADVRPTFKGYQGLELGFVTPLRGGNPPRGGVVNGIGMTCDMLLIT